MKNEIYHVETNNSSFTLDFIVWINNKISRDFTIVYDEIYRVWHITIYNLTLDEVRRLKRYKHDLKYGTLCLKV